LGSFFLLDFRGARFGFAAAPSAATSAAGFFVARLAGAFLTGSGAVSAGVAGADGFFAPAAALVAVLRGRWSGVLLVAVAVRLILDPQDNPYYIGSAVMAAVVFDLLGTRWLVPWATLATAVALWQPFVEDYPNRLTLTTGVAHWWYAHPTGVGWIHLGWALLVLLLVFAAPAHQPTEVRRGHRSAPTGA